MYYSIDQLEADVLEKIANDNLESALFSIQNFVEEFLGYPWNAGIIFGSNILDELCQKIGAKALLIKQNVIADIKPKENPDLIIYITTTLYNTGGHTAVLEDCIRYQPNKQHLILLTGASAESHRDAILSRFSELPVQIEWAPEATLTKKLNWLQERLYKLKPGRIFLFNHHYDAVAIASIQPNISSQVIFYHHADHQLCLGVHLKNCTHIDPHNLGFLQCRNLFGISNNVYLPLPISDLGVRTQPFCKAEKALITCSSGSSHKFDKTLYLYNYGKLVAEILNVTGGKHIHIGNLPTSLATDIKQALDIYKIPMDRFIHVPWTKSLWQTLIEFDVDLFISSFPIGGGRASVEVMGAGIPLVIHNSYISSIMSGQGIAYPGALCWQRPEDLLDLLGKITPEILAEQSQLARRHYELHHNTKIFQKALSADKLEGIEPAPFNSEKRDVLQHWLDIYSYFDNLKTTNEKLNHTLRVTEDRLMHAIKLKHVTGFELLKEFFLRLRKRIFRYSYQNQRVTPEV